MTSSSLPPNSRRRAIVLGGSGLVGRQLVEQLSQDPRYTDVVLLSRRQLPTQVPKVRCEVINFDRPEDFRPLIVGDVLFSCLGTTIKVAGSQEAQFRVDHDYQLWAAQGAADNGVSNYVLVSSIGANAKSRVFYTRMKGQLEEAVSKLGHASCSLLRPSILDGERTEQRPGERLALGVLRNIPDWALPASARPTPVEKVARTCILADQQSLPGVRVIEVAEILKN